jgi:Kelch motif/Galactose oxidase, central domain
MEPSLAAAAYTAETAIEGAAAGALAIARSTVPLKARFYRVPSPSPALKRSSHTLNVIKGRAYIFGGDSDLVGKDGDDAMHVLTLPADLDLRTTDYQKIPAAAKPARPVFDEEGKVESRSADEVKSDESDGDVPAPRAGHCAVVVGDRIYIFGGSRPTGTSDPTAPPNPPLEEDGKVYVFNTISKIWEVLNPNKEGCRDGVPFPRNYASTSSSIHPVPIRHDVGVRKENDQLMTEEAKLRLVSRQQGETLTATDEQDDEGYGTLFLHGGYDSDWNLLRDCWAFDIASRIWSRWPDVPGSDVEIGEGNICCVESRLWRCGDGFGKVAHMDIVRNQFDDMSGKGELGVSPKSGEWEVHAFGVKAGDEELEKAVEKKMGAKPTNTNSLFPARRKRSGFIPVTTGQGRDYLLLFMGENGPRDVLDDVWSFQIASEKKSAAAFKDTVRAIFGKGTGLGQWAKADVVESNKEDGLVDFPKGLSRFGSDSCGDSIGDVVLWGGIVPDGGLSGDGWILTLE